MRKLLSLLGAVALTASSASLVVSYSYAPSINDDISREKAFYSRVSAEALKPGILADQNLSINGQANSGVDIDFSNGYFSTKSVPETFGDLINPDQGAKPDATSQVSSLYGSIFGNLTGNPADSRGMNDQSHNFGYHYSIKDSFTKDSLLANGALKKGTNLYKIAHGADESSRLQKPSSSISSTLNLVSGLANIVFKNDFDPSMGETLISLLTSSTVKNALTSGSYGGIFQGLDAALTVNAPAISQLIDSITQSSLAKDADTQSLNYKKVLEDGTKNVFGSLIYFLSNKQYMYNAGKAPDDGMTTFMKFMQATGASDIADMLKNGDLIPASYAISDAVINDKGDLVISYTGPAFTTSPFTIKILQGTNDVTSSFGAPVVDPKTNTITYADVSKTTPLKNITKDPAVYTMTFGDKVSGTATITGPTTDGTAASAKSTNIDYRDMLTSLSGFVSFGITLIHYFRAFDEMYPKIQSPSDGNHLFSDDPDVTNGDAIEAVLKNKYVGTTKDNSFWYVTKDKDGKTQFSSKLNLQNLISDLDYYLSPADSIGHQPLRLIAMLLGGPTGKLNPILDTLWSAVSSYEPVLVNWIKNLPTIGSLIGDKAQAIADMLLGNNGVGKTALVDLIGWFTSDGQDPTTGYAKNVIQGITSIIGSIDISQFADDKDKEILDIVDGIIQYLNSSDGTKFYTNPWSVIYGGGILYSVGRIMTNVADDEKTPDAIDNVRRIGYSLQRLRDIRTILVMNFNQLANNISILTDKNISVPDWLYKANKASISKFIDYLANNIFTYVQDFGSDHEVVHTSNAYNSFDENRYFTFNSEALGNLISALLPNDKDTTKTQVWLTDASGKKTAVTPIVPIYLAIMNYGKTSTPDGVTGTYSVTLADGSSHTIISDTPFPEKDPTNPNSTANNVYVSSQVFEYLLGVDDTTLSSRTLFRPGSLLMAISNIYGHWYTGSGKDQKVSDDTIAVDSNTDPSEIDPSDPKNKDIDTMNPNSNAAKSLFSALSWFATYTSDSISEMTSVVYGKYLDPKSWRISNVSQKGLDSSSLNDKDKQQLDYDLSFYNADAGKWFTYHVMMQRDATNMHTVDGHSDIGWVVKELMLQDK